MGFKFLRVLLGEVKCFAWHLNFDLDAYAEFNLTDADLRVFNRFKAAVSVLGMFIMTLRLFPWLVPGVQVPWWF